MIPLSRVLPPPNGLYKWLINGGTVILTTYPSVREDDPPSYASLGSRPCKRCMLEHGGNHATTVLNVPPIFFSKRCGPSNTEEAQKNWRYLVLLFVEAVVFGRWFQLIISVIFIYSIFTIFPLDNLFVENECNTWLRCSCYPPPSSTTALQMRHQPASSLDSTLGILGAVFWDDLCFLCINGS